LLNAGGLVFPAATIILLGFLFIHNYLIYYGFSYCSIGVPEGVLIVKILHAASFGVNYFNIG
jgi:hypothetical protein